MDNKKLSYILSAVVGFLLVALFMSTFLANQLLSKKTVELSELKAQNQVVDELRVALKKSQADIEKYSVLNKIAKTVVPQDKNQAQTISEIVKIASDSGIPKISSITFPASTLGGTGSTRSQSSLTQVTPVKGAAGVYLLPITITVDANNAIRYSQFITFLQKLENNRRTAQVTAVNITPDIRNPNNISFTLTVNQYLKP